MTTTNKFTCPECGHTCNVSTECKAAACAVCSRVFPVTHPTPSPYLDGTLPKGCGAWDVTSFPFGGDFIRPSIDIRVTNIRPSAKEGWMLADCEGYPNRNGKRTICSNKFSLL